MKHCNSELGNIHRGGRKFLEHTVTEYKYYFNRYINNIVNKNKKRNTESRVGLAYRLQVQVFNNKVNRVIDRFVEIVFY